MKTSFKIFLFAISAALVLVGATTWLNGWMYSPYLFAVGTAGITVYYLILPLPASADARLRRLHRINVIAGILMIVASVFMFKQRMEWVVLLLISALIQFYTSFVTPDDKRK